MIHPPPRITYWRRLIGRFFLRKVNQLGMGAIVLGRPDIENEGHLAIGAHLYLSSRIARSRIAVKRGARLEIGDHCWINGAIIAATQEIIIGNHCRFAPYTHLMDGDFHDLEDRQQAGRSGPIIIEDDVWLGARSMVLKGVTIHRGARVAPGAVVTKDVPAGATVEGVPARVK